MRILLAAEEAAGLQVLRMLANGEDTVAGVLTSGKSAGGMTNVGDFAERLGFPVYPAETVQDPEPLADLDDIDLLLNVHSLYRIDPSLIDLPIIGAFNLHPGPLPTYSGLNAPSWALYLGETTHAVTLHWIVADIDAGPIAYTSEFPITPEDTGLTVARRCVTDGIPLVQRLLEQARSDPGGVPAIPQSEEGRQVFYRSQVPNGGRIDWTASAEAVSRLVRACDYYPLPSPWGSAWTLLGDVRHEVRKVRTDTAESDALPGTIFNVDETGAWVAAGSGSVVVEKTLTGGKSTDAAGQFEAGQRFT